MDENLILKIIDESIERGVIPALKANGVKPGPFFDHLSKHPKLMEKFIEYQHVRAELALDEMISISDDENIPVDRVKVMMLSRQNYIPRANRQKYGEKLSIEHTHKLDLRGAIEEARARAGQVIDVTPAQIATIENAQVADDTVAWGEKVVEALPRENQPIDLSQDEDDIFS